MSSSSLAAYGFFFMFLFSFVSAISPLVALNDVYTIDEAGVEYEFYSSIGVLNNDQYSSSSIVLLSKNVSHGQLYLAEDGSFVYMSDSSFKGVDFFDYVINEGESNSSSARVYLGVGGNTASITVKDVYTIDEAGVEYEFYSSIGVLNNDGHDSEGDFSWTLLSYSPNDAFYFNLADDGSFVYIANEGFHGVDRFSYVISDGHLNSSSTRVYLGVNNSAPVAVQDKYFIDSSINTTFENGVLANDSDIDNDELELSITEDVKFGELKTENTGFSVNGSFNYTSNKTNGVDYFVYKLTDFHLSDSARCIFVIGNNTAPVANNDSYYTSLNTKLNVGSSLGILANDADAEDDVLFLDVLNSTLNGTLHVNDDGSFNYTPDNGFVGVDSFIYRLSDLDKDSSDIEVKIYVNTSVISNITDDADNDTNPGDNVTVNVSSEVYPLVLNFQLVNSTGIVNEFNFTANDSSDVPTNYSVPTGLAAGNYILYLSLYNSDNKLLNKTTLAEFEVEAVVVPDTPTTTGGGNGGTNRRIQNLQNLLDNNTIPSTNTGLANNTNPSPTANTTNTRPNVFNTITGNVIGTTAGRWSLGIVIFLILVGLAYWFVAKKRKSAEKPVKVVKLSSKKKN